MLAAFTELGPYTYKYNASETSVRNRGSLTYNKYSWNNNANVLFIDQPLGTGFSFMGNDTFKYLRTNTDLIAEDFYSFLTNFYKKYPEFKNQDLYLTGESFAGHYIPAISNFLHVKKNVKIAGIAIGNGWVDPFY
jgi:cathepsin A (carboxypeptidase C)